MAAVTDPTRAPEVRPRASARRVLVLSLAAVTVVVEILSLANVLPLLHLGDINLSPSLVPGLALAAACGERLFGRSSSRATAVAYWLVAAVVLTVAVVTYHRLSTPLNVPGVVLAAFDEELVYRLAVPAVIALLLRAFRVEDTAARIAGFVVGGVWFVLLPGHREQMTDPGQALPFIAFAALMALVVYRSGSVVPAAITHACANLFTILVWTEEVHQGARQAILCSLLIVLVLAYGKTRRFTKGDDGRVIDLRSGYPVTVTEGGQVMLVLDDHQPADVVPLPGATLSELRPG